MKDKWSWHEEPPTEDGDFFYDGVLPLSDETITCIVQITTDPEGGRVASVFLPPYWRGQKDRTKSSVHWGPLKEWTGMWSGPEFGLCTATYP
jgi:hypothetical protein